MLAYLQNFLAYLPNLHMYAISTLPLYLGVGGVHVLVVLVAPPKELLVALRVHQGPILIIESEPNLQVHHSISMHVTLNHRRVVPHIVVWAVHHIAHIQTGAPLPILIRHLAGEGCQVP